MRLDLDFIRKLLLKIDEFKTFEPITNKDLIDNDTPINQVNAYLDLLIEEELISAKRTAYLDGNKLFQINYLTIKGQKFVDVIKTQSFWEKHKQTILSAGILSLQEIILTTIKVLT
jgi:hypothetical protein